MFDKHQSLKVKGIAICLLLFHHLFYSADRIAANGVVFHLFEQEQVSAVATGARICVWIFAFLSAYGLSIQYLKLGENPTMQKTLAYTKKHWLSLMKPYWFIIGFTFILWIILKKNPMDLYNNSILNLILCIFGISDFFGTKMAVGAWWYMCFAQIVLLSIPILVKLCKKYGILTLIASFILLQYVNTGIQSSSGGRYTNYLFAVILGAVFACNGTMEKLGKKSKHKLVCVFEFFALIALIIGLIKINMAYSSIDKWYFTKLSMAFAAVLISLLIFKYFTHPLIERVLIFLGNHSGNIFLLHCFGYLFYPKIIYWSHNVVISWFTLLALSLIGSFLCQYLLKLGTTLWKKIITANAKSPQH